MRTPRTASPSTSSASTGNPANRLTPACSGPLAHPTHDLADGCRVEPGVVHGGRGGNALSAALGHEVHRFARDGLAERDVAGVEVGKELVEGARVHHGAGEIVLAQRTRLFQHGDVELAETAARLRVLLRQPGQLDGAGQPGGPCPDDHDIHLDRLGARRIAADDLIERQRTLVSGGDDGGHVGQLLGRGRTSRRRKYNPPIRGAKLVAWTCTRRRGTPGSGDNWRCSRWSALGAPLLPRYVDRSWGRAHGSIASIRWLGAPLIAGGAGARRLGSAVPRPEPDAGH